MIFRNCRSASSMPAAVQRSAISPDDHRFTLRWVRRTISIIDSQGLVLSSVRLSEPLTPSRVSVSVSSMPSRSEPAAPGIAAVELAGEPLELVECTSVVVERPRPAQPLLHRGPLPFGQMVDEVALLVPQTALHRRVTEDVADSFAQRLGAVDHEQDPLLGIEAALDQVRERSRSRSSLPRVRAGF